MGTLRGFPYPPASARIEQSSLACHATRFTHARFVARRLGAFKRLRPPRARGTLALRMRTIASVVVMFAVFAGASLARAAGDAPAPLGVSYAGWKGEYRAAAK